MIRKTLYPLLYFSLLCGQTDGPSSSTNAQSPPCDIGSRACNATARYIQGAGVGYHHSYTTLELFLAPPRCYESWSPYCDLRGHVFNNGKLASNAGIGLRYIDSIAWGANAYYDYRKTNQYHYNQIGAGLEAIGSFWSVNINGYLPVGKKKSPFFDTGITGVSSADRFAFFQGNQIFIQLSGTQALKAKQEFAFKGLNASATFRVAQDKLFALDVSAGPYYFDGYCGKYAAGGQGAATLRIKDFFSLGLIGSYDNLFHTRIQGSAAFSVPIGPRSFGKSCRKELCKIPTFYDFHLARGADRNEIVVVDRCKKIIADASEGPITVAINPTTGAPYLVWFVDNTSNSAGTYESPFPTLLQAQTASGPNDLIYVFPGDGTDMGMDAGITLQNSQKLLGSGTNYALPTTQGIIVIPAQSATAPLITNAGGTIVALANNNALSGLHMGTSSIAAEGSSIKNLQVLSCQVDASTLPISLMDCTGSILIHGNTFENYTDRAVQINSTTGSSTLVLASNTYTAMAAAPSTYGITASLSGSAQATLKVKNSTFSEHTVASISFSSSGSSVMNPIISNNTMTAPAAVANTVGIALQPGGSASTASILGNTLINHEGNSIDIRASSAVLYSSTITNNTVQGIAGTSTKAIAQDTDGTATSTWSTLVMGNTCTGGFTQADIYIDPQGSSNLTSAIVKNNTTIGDNGASSPYGIQLDADDTATVGSLQISNNTSRNHIASEISVAARGSASQVTTTIFNNQLSTTGGIASGNGVQLLSSNASSIIGEVYNNTITDMHNTSIGCFTGDTSTGQFLVYSNDLQGPSGIANTIGIGFNSSGSSSLDISISNNTLEGFSNYTLSSSIADASTASSSISSNTIVGIAGTSQKGISISSATGATGSWSTLIQNNALSGGFIEADIFLDPQGTATLTSAIVSRNTTIGPDDGSAPHGIQLNADEGSTVTSLLITNNTSKNHSSAEIDVTARGSSSPAITSTISNNILTSDAVATSQLIVLNCINDGTLISEVVNNTCSGMSTNAIKASCSNSGILNTAITGNTCSNYTSNGISINCSNTAVATASVSKNILTGSLDGIVMNISDSSTLDTTIDQNTLTGHGNQSININYFASNLICSISNNTVITDSTSGNALGIIANLGGASQTFEVINNSISVAPGGIGNQFGIVCAQQSMSGSLKSISIYNNRVVDCGNAPPTLAPFTGGIGLVSLNTDDIFADCQSNTTVNCGIGVAGLGGIIGARLNFGVAPGNFCWTLQNCDSDTDFALINDPPAGIAAEFTLDASGNTGTVIPYMSSPFTVGTCP